MGLRVTPGPGSGGRFWGVVLGLPERRVERDMELLFNPATISDVSVVSAQGSKLESPKSSYSKALTTAFTMLWDKARHMSDGYVFFWAVRKLLSPFLPSKVLCTPFPWLHVVTCK